MRSRLVAAAWELAREHGLAGVSQRTLADKVGLAQPSLYSYFASKNDMYDAMFRDGNEQLVARMEALELPDPVRYQLLFQRTLPGFRPSEESYAVAMRFYEWHRARLTAVGIRGQAMMDVFVALQAGLHEAQLANDPGGTRWSRHLDWVITTFVDKALSERRKDGHAHATTSRAAPRRADRDRSRREPRVVQQPVRDQLPHGGTASRRSRKAPG
jgi:AcrR family transcriptional regulator